MEKKQEQSVRIKVKKIGIRGDEVAILFFSLVFLAFLFISFFRLFAVGKLFDDFIFLFLFGWSKYLVYFVLFIIIIPICFNYYFRFKATFIMSLFLTLFAISWLVSNINLIIQSKNADPNIWWQLNAYQFKDFSNYFQEWWNGTIIKNYHGFFAKPISFENWKSINSFFPSFAAGGVLGNFLIVVSSYGTFVTNFILNIIVLLIGVNWLFFSKPWLFFTSFGIFFKPFHNLFRKKKIESISEKSLRHKSLLDLQEENNEIKQLAAISVINVTDSIDSISKVEKQTEQISAAVKSKNKEIIIHKVIQESGNLTPFGKVNKDQTVEINFEEEIPDTN